MEATKLKEDDYIILTEDKLMFKGTNFEFTYKKGDILRVLKSNNIKSLSGKLHTDRDDLLDVIKWKYYGHSNPINIKCITRLYRSDLDEPCYRRTFFESHLELEIFKEKIKVINEIKGTDTREFIKNRLNLDLLEDEDDIFMSPGYHIDTYIASTNIVGVRVKHIPTGLYYKSCKTSSIPYTTEDKYKYWMKCKLDKLGTVFSINYMTINRFKSIVKRSYVPPEEVENFKIEYVYE